MGLGVVVVAARSRARSRYPEGSLAPLGAREERCLGFWGWWALLRSASWAAKREADEELEEEGSVRLGGRVSCVQRGLREGGWGMVGGW